MGGDPVVAGPRVRLIAHPEAVLTRLPRHHTQHRAAIVGRSPMPLARVRSSTRRVMSGAMWGACFPRVLVEFVCLTRGSGHQLGWRRMVQVRWHPWPEGLQWHARQAHLAGQARRRFTLGNAPQQEHQRRWPLAGVLERGASTVTHQDRGGARARGCRCCRRAIQQSESQSCRDDSTSCTVARHDPKPLGRAFEPGKEKSQCCQAGVIVRCANDSNTGNGPQEDNHTITNA
jgi:hypothetical protein